MMSGCGTAGLPMSALSPSGAMQAAAAKKQEPKNPFLGLTATVQPLAVLCECVQISATNGAKLKVNVSTEGGSLDGVTVNRSTLVSKGRLVLNKEETGGMLLGEDLEASDTGASREERRRKSFLKILDKLADGLKTAKTEKKDAKQVAEVAEAVKAFVKQERAKDDDNGATVLN
jgi:hypothetical protein